MSDPRAEALSAGMDVMIALNDAQGVEIAAQGVEIIALRAENAALKVIVPVELVLETGPRADLVELVLEAGPRAYFEITAGIIRVFTDGAAKFGTAWDFDTSIAGDGGCAHIKALRVAVGEKFTTAHRRAIFRALKAVGFTSVKWERHDDPEHPERFRTVTHGL